MLFAILSLIGLAPESLHSSSEKPRYHPLRIKHIRCSPGDDRAALCLACSKALRLAKGEYRVLCFYARCSDGFRPSLQLVADESFMTKRHAERVRTSLVRHGLIAVDNDTVFVDWHRLRLFSTLDPKQTGKKAYCAPVEIGRKQQIRRKQARHLKTGSEDFFRFSSPAVICKYLSQLSEAAYAAKVAEINDWFAYEE